jgi:hypothetical protein
MNSDKRMIGSVTGGVVLVGLIAAGVWAYRVRAHAQYVSSLQDPGKVIQASIDGEISDKERDDALKSGMEARMGQQLDEYFKLSPGAQRTAYLDKRIDDMERARKMMEAGGPSTQPEVRHAIKAASTQPDGVSVSTDGNKRIVRIKGGPQSMESLPPARRAQLAEFMADLNKRRAERGLPTGGGAMMIKIEQKGP